MTAPDLVDRLAAHETLGSAPREELEWLAAHGSLRRLDEGEVLSAKGVPVAGMFVVLTGHIAIFVDRGAGRHKVMEWWAGDVTGMLPYSRLVSPPGDSVAQEPSESWPIPRDDLREMIRECHEITSHPRAQDGRSQPAVHVERSARREDGLARQAVGRTRARAEQPGGGDRAQRGAARGPAGGRRAGDARARRRAAERRAARRGRRGPRLLPGGRRAGVLSPIQQAEREEAIADWLADHGVEAAIAGPLAETAVTLDALDRIASGRGRTVARAPCCGGRRPDARCGASPPRSRRRRCGSPAWSRRSRVSRTWTRRTVGRAGGPRLGPGQHGRRAQVEGARRNRSR